MFREANQLADAIAKVNLSSSDNSLIVIQSIPNCIDRVILDDVRGVKLPMAMF